MTVIKRFQDLNIIKLLIVKAILLSFVIVVAIYVHKILDRYTKNLTIEKSKYNKYLLYPINKFLALIIITSIAYSVSYLLLYIMFGIKM